MKKFMFKCIKKIINNKIIQFIIIKTLKPFISILYNTIYFFSYKENEIGEKELNNISNLNQLKIGIAAYPQTHGYKGGDSTVNFLIKQVLEEKNHIVEFINYDFTVISGFSLIKKFFAKLVGMPFIYSELINKYSKNYDIVISDSGINFHISHPRCINLL